MNSRQILLRILAQNFYKLEYVQKLQKPLKTRMNMYRAMYQNQKILLIYQSPHSTVLMKQLYKSWNAMNGGWNERYMGKAWRKASSSYPTNTSIFETTVEAARVTREHRKSKCSGSNTTCTRCRC